MALWVQTGQLSVAATELAVRPGQPLGPLLSVALVFVFFRDVPSDVIASGCSGCATYHRHRPGNMLRFVLCIPRASRLLAQLLVDGITCSLESNRFTFDRVFGHDSTTSEVYDYSVQPLWR